MNYLKDFRVVEAKKFTFPNIMDMAEEEPEVIQEIYPILFYPSLK